MTLAEHTTRRSWPLSLPRQTELQDELHRPHQPSRRAIILALHSGNDLKLRKTAERLAACSSTVLITHSASTATTRPWLPRCGSRLCPFCGRGRAGHIADKLRAIIDEMHEPRHLVFTYRSRPEGLALQLKQLRAAFSRLRRCTEWSKYVRGGIYSIEVTRNPATGLWHPHLHVIADGSYLPQKLLQRLWSTVMPGGEHVWITKVDDTAGAAWEVAKYVGKPPKVHGWPPSAIVEFARATHGMRMLQGFGEWFNRQLPAEEEEPYTHPDDRFVSLPRVTWLANWGEPHAQDLVAMLWVRWPMLRGYLQRVAPGCCACTGLHTLPGLKLPLPPLLPRGRLGPITDEAALTALDQGLHCAMTALFWLQDNEGMDVEHDAPGV